MRKEIIDEIIEVLHKFHKGGTTIGPQTDIAAELDLDSLAVMDVLMELEERMDISIPLNLVPDIRTVGDLAKTIEQLKEDS